MAQLSFSGHGGTSFPYYFNPNIFFQSTPSDPTPIIPAQNKAVYILASVKNSGSMAATNATVQFWVCNPATVPTPVNSTLIGTSNVSLDAGETKTVLCVTPWFPKWINNGHECVICEVSATNDLSPAHPTTPWNVYDRHVAQHNVNIIAQVPHSGHPFLIPIAAVGLHNEPAAKIAILPAPDALFAPALLKFGLSHYNNATKDSTSGLILNYVAGDPLPDKGTVERNLTLRDLEPNHELAFHTLVGLPDKALDASAALFLVEQYDSKGKVVGGVAVIVLGGGGGSAVTPTSSVTPAIPASIPYRPYSTMPSTGFMTPDGIFVTNLGTQLINVETKNDGSQALQGLSVYVEGVADPMVSVPIALASPSGGEALAAASFKSVFSADFSKATPGETVVSFIVQQQSGTSSKSTRILKKIFVLAVDFDKSTKDFTVNLPQGTLHFHIQTVIAPAKIPCDCPTTSRTCKCCCGCGSSDGRGSGSIPYPALITKATMNLVSNPAYPGTYGPLPFNDPWWKVIFIIAAAILLYFGGKEATQGGGGGEVSGGPSGKFDETDGSVNCCDGAQVSAETDKGIAAVLIALGVVCAAIAAASDDADLHDRGRTQTPPKPGELTVSELVHFNVTHMDAPSPGTKFGGSIAWDYTRTLDSGRVLKYATENNFSNIHYLKSYKVNVDGMHDNSGHYTHQRRDMLIIGAQFTKPNGELFRGPQLYAFALLFHTSGFKTMVELRDDGNGYLGGFDPEIPIPKLAISAGAAMTPTLGTGMSVEKEDERQPNTGSYVGFTAITREFTGNWYLFVFAQDINTTLEGTEPRKAAQTIGGMLLTTQYALGLNGKPCQMNYDAIITVV